MWYVCARSFVCMYVVCVYVCVVWGVCILAHCTLMEAKGQRQASSLTRHVILRQGRSLELTIPDWLTANPQDLSVSVQQPCCYTVLLLHPTFKWVPGIKASLLTLPTEYLLLSTTEPSPQLLGS